MLCASTISALCYWKGAAMAELHVICALRDKRSELAGMMNRLEQQLAQNRASLAGFQRTDRLGSARREAVMAPPAAADIAWLVKHSRSESALSTHDECPVSRQAQPG